MRKILKVLEPGQSVVIIPPSGEYRTVTKNLAADQRRYGLFLDIKFERVLIMVKSEDKVIDGVLVERAGE